MPSFDSIRQQAPWMRDWSDEEVMLKLSELTNTPLADVAKDFGVKTGAERSVLGAGGVSGWEGLKGLGYSGGAAVADVLGAEGAKDWLERQALAKEVQSNIASRPELEKIEEQNLGSALPYLGYQVAKQIPNIAGAVAAGALVPEVAIPAALTRGAAMLPRALGGGGLGSRLAAAGTEAGAGFAAKRAALETGQAFGKQVVGGLAFNEAQSVGSLYQAAREGGDENAGAKALLGSPLYALSETLPEAMLVGRFKGGSGFTGNILTRMGKSAGVQGVSGATSEGLQNEMEMALNPNLTPEQQFSNRLNSVAAGGLVEGLLGGFGGMAKGSRLPSGGSLINGATTSDQPATSQTPDDRGTNTAIDASSSTPSVLDTAQAAEIDRQKLAQFGVLPPETERQAQEQLDQAKQEANAQAQQQAQMQAAQQQEQRNAALNAFGVTYTSPNQTTATFMGQPIAGTGRINALADTLQQALSGMSEMQVRLSQAAIQANSLTGGKLLKFKVDGGSPQKTAQNGFSALAKVMQSYMIDEASSLEEAADILNTQSLGIKGDKLEQLNALYEALTGQNTDGYKQSQGETNGKLQATSRLGTVSEQGGASQAAGTELGLLRPEPVQPIGAGSVPVGSNAVQANAGREGGVRTGAGNGPATSVSGNVSAPSPQVTGVHRGQQASTQQAKPVAGAVKVSGGARNAVNGKAGGENVALSTEQAEAVLKDVPKLLRSILGNVFRSAKKVEFLATFQKKGHYETHEEVGERLGLKKSTIKDYAKLLAVDKASGLPKFIADNLEAFRRAFAAEARKLGVTPEQVMHAISTVSEVEETQELDISDREVAEAGLAVQEHKYRTDTEGKKTGKVDRTNVSDLAEEGNTAEALSNQYVKLAEAQQAAEDAGNTEESASLQAQMDEVTGKIAALSKRRTKAKAKVTEETENAVQEPSTEEVPLRKRAGGGEGVRKENAGKRKAAKEAVKVEANPEEKWDAIAEQYGLPKFSALPSGAQADVIAVKGELTTFKANEIFEAYQNDITGETKEALGSYVPKRKPLTEAQKRVVEKLKFEYEVETSAGPKKFSLISLDDMKHFPGLILEVLRMNSAGLGNSLDYIGSFAIIERGGPAGFVNSVTNRKTGIASVVVGVNYDMLVGTGSEDSQGFTLSHEIGHAVDEANFGGVFSSQHEFNVQPSKTGKFNKSLMGSVMRELYSLYQTDAQFKDVFSYPFAHEDAKTDAEFIREEVFAQTFAMYNSKEGKALLKEKAPLAYEFMEDVEHEIKTGSFQAGTREDREAQAEKRYEQFQTHRGLRAELSKIYSGQGKGEKRLDQPRFSEITAQTKQWVGQSKGFIDSLPTWARGPVRTVHNVLFGGKETALGLMITEDIAELAKKFMGSVTKYVEVQHLRNSLIATKERRLTSVKTMFEDLDTNSRRAVNNLIADMTINGKWAFDPQLEGVKAEHIDEALKNRFNALPSGAQKVVREVFAVGRESLQEKKDTIRKTIDDNFAQQALSATTEAEKAGIARRKADMEKQFSGILNINPNTPYAPLKRFGSFVVVAKSQAYLDAEAANDTKEIHKLNSDENHYVVEFAETAGEAEQIHDELNAMGGYKVSAPFKKSTARDSLYRGTDLYKGFAKLQRLIKAEKHLDENIDSANAELMRKLDSMVNDLYLLSLADSSARKSEMERKKIAGFNRDMMRAFFTQGMADAHYIANLKTADQSMDTMVQMQKEAGENRAQAYPYLNEIMAREAQSLEIREPSLGDAMNRMAGDWFLTFSPSFYFQQLTQTYVLSLPWLAGKYNYFKSERALRQAYKQILPLVKGTGLKEHMDFSKAPDDVREMLETLVGRGRIDIGVEAELSGVRSEATNPMSEAYNSAANRLRGAINRIEALNRSVAAIAAYRLEMQKSGDKAKAIDAADKVVHVTHGSYDGFNTPRLFNKNAVTRSLTQFRRFQIIQLSMLARMVHNAFKGADKTERAMGRKQLAFLLGHTFALGGVKGMPIYVPAALAYSLITGAFGDEDDPEDFEAWLRSQGGLLLARGIPANMGIDLSGKLGMGNVLSVLPYTDVDLSSKQGYANLLLGASGPFLGGLVPKMIDGVNLVAGGDYYRGLEQMLPNGLNNGIKVLRFNTEGITMRNGDVVMPPEEIGFADSVAQLLGMPTATMTERQYTQGQVIKFDQFYTDRAKELKRDYTSAYKSNDSAAMAESRDAWNNLQESRVKYGYTRKPLSELIKAPREQAKRERGVVGGVETTKSNKAFVQRLTEE